MLEIVAGIIGFIVLWLVGSYTIARYRLHRYKKMLATISHEDVQERAKKFKYTEKDFIAGKQPPVLRAWDELLAEKRKEHKYK